MEIGSQAGLIGQLSRAEATILLLLLVAGKPLSLGAIAAGTGLEELVVRRCLNRLTAAGLVLRQESGWITSAAVGRLLLKRQPDEPNKREAAAGQLADVLTRIGISPPALERLCGRQDLQREPALALGWWWYYLSQEWPTNRVGLVIRRLDEGQRPPAGYLNLALAWPRISEREREVIEGCLWRGWSPNQLTRRFEQIDPRLSVEACAALKGLYERAPGVLGY